MRKQEIINEIYRQARKNFLRRSVVLKKIDEFWQADLMDMRNFKDKNSGYTFVLVVIDTFSKFAWTMPVKNKTKNEVTDAFYAILSKGRIPKHLQTDLGTEFYNDCFKNLMKTFKINHYSTYSVKKASIVERLIRTLKHKLYKNFHLSGKYEWIGNPLKKITKDYNQSVHRITKFKPSNVNSTNESEVLQNILKSRRNVQSTKAKFKIGDIVRISKYKGVFDKGYTPNWSTELFTIIKINDTNPVTYQIQDQRKQNILGTFYEQELMKTKHPDCYLIEKVLKKRGNKLFVKWLGFVDSENSWVSKKDLA